MRIEVPFTDDDEQAILESLALEDEERRGARLNICREYLQNTTAERLRGLREWCAAGGRDAPDPPDPRDPLLSALRDCAEALADAHDAESPNHSGIAYCPCTVAVAFRHARDVIRGSA